MVPKLKKYSPFWVTYSEKEKTFYSRFLWKIWPFSHFCRFWYPNWVIWVTHPAPKNVPFHLDFGRTCFPTQVRSAPRPPARPPPPPPRPAILGSEQYTHLIIICLKHAWFWLTRVLKNCKCVKKPLTVQGINLFPCVYGIRMINIMLYQSIFAFYLSYYLYLYSTESKEETELFKAINSIK